MYMKMRGTPENINAAGVAAGRKGLTCTEIGGWPYSVNGHINWNDTLGGGRATNNPQHFPCWYRLPEEAGRQVLLRRQV